MSSIFWDHFPTNRRHLLGPVSGNSILEEVSETEFRDMLIECLTGRNPRILTENWAQAKIYHGVFTGIEEMFIAGKESHPDFVADAPIEAAKFLQYHYKAEKNSPDRLKKDDIILCQWVCNLTNKGWDNILQANSDNLIDWGNSVLSSIDKVAYGDKEKNIVNMTIYNASLAKKGGLKSAMGNLFESLLLYSGLSVCGLRFAKAEDFSSAKWPCFTLDVNERRQVDAQIKTNLRQPGKINIDIGFIGKGNPEIIADKTQRFANAAGSSKKPLHNTIIIVSAIPETEEAQLVVRQATMLGAQVITMSGKNWVHVLGKVLKSTGIQGLADIPENINQAREQLNETLPAPEEIIQSIPKNLSVPEHWNS
ncbi:MAG: hypothetical protein ISN29_09870 [Gammaproteobacteria bacterium AqS3]|nr:hypothetical protein [Gammaproteobacteria bacterium AqS3]